ncbi:TonB-dependent receptor [uncultured Nitrosomonas sp.]|uniref:TonB-dependent receptor n=1 Tax=uncultured Nitrosomonas sp. TaxID=156424 RepID=UPI00261D07BD|nr:TonB-dependent receptor [uncultured Nitrosomonas sp.]
MKKLEILIGLVTFTGLSFCVCAQEVTSNPADIPGDTNPTPLKPVVITADPLRKAQTTIPQPVSVLRQEGLQTRDLSNIGEAVSRELGVSSADFGSAVGRPVIRGLGGARVRVLENGISTMDVSTVSPDHAVAAEALFADQIEIFRGSSALLYGSGASGGVVNIVNQRIPEQVPEEAGGDLYGHYGSVSDDFTGAFRLNAGAGHFAWHLDGMKRHAGNYSIPGYAEPEPEPGAKKGMLENSDVRTKNFSSGLSYIGEQGFLGVAVSRFVNHYGVPGHDHGQDANENSHDGSDVLSHEGTTRIRQKQTRFDIKGALDHPLPGLQKIKLRWGYNNHAHRESGGAEDGTLLLNREWDGRLEMLHQPLGSWDGVLGLQYQNRNFSSAGQEAFVPDSRMDSLGVFLLEKRDIRRWLVEIGGRFEHQWTERKEDSLKVDHGVFSVSGGATWKFLEGYALKSNISHTMRAPALEELYSGGPHLATNSFEIGNTTLSSEKTSSIDLSLGKQSGNLSWTLNLFASRVNDFIFLRESDMTGDGLPDRVNTKGLPDSHGLLLLNYDQRNANFLGAEFETNARLLNDHRGKLDLRLWSDYVRGRLSGGGYLPRMTPLRFGGSLDYIHGPWRSRVDVMRVHKQTDVAALETNTDGYTMLNAQLDYRFDWGRMNYNLFIRGSNLLNEEARRHTSFLKDRAPLPGRSGLVGIRINF